MHTMTAEQFAQVIIEVKGILNRLNSKENWNDVWNSIATDRDRALTKSLCDKEIIDFIIVREDHAYLFMYHQIGWIVWYVGQPIYWADPKLFSGLDFGSLMKNLRRELEGVEIRKGSNSFNENSLIMDFFRNKINSAIKTAISNSG